MSSEPSASFADSRTGRVTKVFTVNCPVPLLAPLTFEVSGVGRFHEHLGALVHEQGEPLDDPATVRSALAAAGLSEHLAREAMEDSATLDRVAAEHRELCDRTRSFGVPTIVLDGGEGPAIFGPVIVDVPDDDDAVALWEHVSWLVRHDSFAELKRERDRSPALESVRRWQQRQVERAAS